MEEKFTITDDQRSTLQREMQQRFGDRDFTKYLRRIERIYDVYIFMEKAARRHFRPKEKKRILAASDAIVSAVMQLAEFSEAGKESLFLRHLGDGGFQILLKKASVVRDELRDLATSLRSQKIGRPKRRDGFIVVIYELASIWEELVGEEFTTSNKGNKAVGFMRSVLQTLGIPAKGLLSEARWLRKRAKRRKAQMKKKGGGSDGQKMKAAEPISIRH